MKPARQNILVLIIMLIVFVAYNCVVYTTDCAAEDTKLSEEALAGQHVWQSSNCSACHQLYGLGGYLGPDLTNVISAQGKGPNYVKAFVNSAYKSMPEYKFSEGEIDQLVAFLTAVDKTGTSPAINAEIKSSGWIELKYK